MKSLHVLECDHVKMSGCFGATLQIFIFKVFAYYIYSINPRYLEYKRITRISIQCHIVRYRKEAGVDQVHTKDQENVN